MVAELWCRRIEVLTDDGHRVGMLIWRRTGKQVKYAGSQGVLVCASVDFFTHQLLGRRIGDRSDGEVGRR
jgi:hypothetical protein